MKQIWRRYKILFIVTLVVVAIAAYYIISVRSAVDKLAVDLNEAYWKEAGDENLKTEMHQVPGYNELLQQKCLLEAQVKMAGSDSIGLYLDLHDSIAQLMVKGISVRDIPVRNMKMSPLFGKIDTEVLFDLFSKPLQVTGSWATIAKMPINVVQAPKDSSDVIPMIKPDTANIDPVYFILDTDRNVRFYFYQTEDSFSDQIAAFKFNWPERRVQAEQTIRSVFTFTPLEYIPTIRIGMSREDAKVLYRALPDKGLVVVKI